MSAKKKTDAAPRVLVGLREPLAPHATPEYRENLERLGLLGPFRLDVAGMMTSRGAAVACLHGIALALSRGEAKGSETGGVINGREVRIRWKLEKVKG